MEARIFLQQIRQQGFIIKAMGNTISLAPKKQLNDRIISLVCDYKEALLTALYQEQDAEQILHIKQKGRLRQGRIEILRLILRRHLGITFVEKFLDGVLIQFCYDLEKAIDHYRSITPEPYVVDGQCKCGYMPPFCTCKIL